MAGKEKTEDICLAFVGEVKKKKTLNTVLRAFSRGVILECRSTGGATDGRRVN